MKQKASCTRAYSELSQISANLKHQVIQHKTAVTGVNSNYIKLEQAPSGGDGLDERFKHLITLTNNINDQANHLNILILPAFSNTIKDH